jgi:glycerol-3-phosphate acyltransferase PlsX
LSIALDAMGGDFAPGNIIEGALEAADQLRMPIILVGDLARMKPYLPAVLPSNVHLHPASQTVEMDEKPTDAYRKKKDSSLMVAVRLVKEGRAKAMVSAGNTGAASAFSLLSWRQLPGIHRPAIAAPMPNKHDGFVLLDAGASVDAEPQDLVEFAHMGRAYAERVMGRHQPRVHLLNIGEEEGKGNAFAKQTFNLLKPYPWFAGNIEGKDIFGKSVDVVICDAFVGNVLLKTCEGMAELIVGTIRDGVPNHPLERLMYWPVGKVTAPVKRKMDYSEIGGSPLLGLNGICMICHGRSNAKAIKNALLNTQRMIQEDLVSAIATAVKP